MTSPLITLHVIITWSSALTQLAMRCTERGTQQPRRQLTSLPSSSSFVLRTPTDLLAKLCSQTTGGRAVQSSKLPQSTHIKESALAVHSLFLHVFKHYFHFVFTKLTFKFAILTILLHFTVNNSFLRLRLGNMKTGRN